MSASVRALAPPLYNTLQWASPFLIDQIVYQIFARTNYLKTSWLVSSIAGGVAIWKICPQSNQKLVGGLYLAYKVFHFFYSGAYKATKTVVKVLTESEVAQLLPSPQARYAQYQALLEHFTITQPCSDSKLFDQTLKDQPLISAVCAIPNMQELVEEKTQLWSGPTARAMVESLIQQASNSLDKIYQYLETEAGKRNYQGMANIIVANPEIAKWIDGTYASLKHFYEWPRYRHVNVVLKKGAEKRVVSMINQYKGIDPFWTPGAPEYQWRERYNQVMKKFEPIVNLFPIDSLIRKFMVQDNPEETY